MVFNILILHKDIQGVESTKKLLEESRAYEKTALNIELSNSLSSSLDLIKKNYFNIIFGDYELLTSDSFALFALPITTKIYSLKRDREQDDLFEESILRGSIPLIGDIESCEFVESKIVPIFDETKYKDSYSNLLINSMLELYSCSDISNLMISYAKAACKRFEITGLKRGDIIRVLSLLSISLKNHSLFKTVRFFERMRIADELLDLTHQFLEPYSIEGYIIHTVYHHTKLDILELSHDNCCKNIIPKEIHDEIVDIIKEHKIFIDKGLDIESVWVKLIESLNDLEIDTQTYDAFIKISNELSRRSIFYYQGAFISITNRPDSVTYTLLPATQMPDSELKRVLESVDLTNNIDVKEENGGFIVTVSASVSSQKENHAHSKTFVQKPVHQRELISATEYLESLDNLEDVLDSVEMLEGYEDLTEKIILQTNTITKETLEQASEVLTKYSHLLGMQESFKDLSYVVLTLTSILKSADEKKLKENNKQIATMLSSMIDDLRSWKTSLFITKTTKDIHYLDDSLYSSCLQMERLLSATIELTEDDDNNLELF